MNSEDSDFLKMLAKAKDKLDKQELPSDLLKEINNLSENLNKQKVPNYIIPEPWIQQLLDKLRKEQCRVVGIDYAKFPDYSVAFKVQLSDSGAIEFEQIDIRCITERE